jgi:hypothetical protein
MPMANGLKKGVTTLLPSLTKLPSIFLPVLCYCFEWTCHIKVMATGNQITEFTRLLKLSVSKKI